MTQTTSLRPETPLAIPRSNNPKQGTPHPAKWVRSPYALSSHRKGHQRRRSDVLAMIFPAVAHALGEDRYQELARDYIGAHRSDYAQVADLAVGFPEFLRLDVGSLTHRKFIVELASLEYAIHKTTHAAPHNGRSAAGHLAPGRNLDQLRINFNEGTRLLHFDYQVNEYRAAVEQMLREQADEFVAAPGKTRANWLALYHRDGIANRVAVSREQFDLLRALSRGRTIADLMRYADADNDDQINLWISRWLTEGLLIAA